ncbi:MAG: phosphoglycerate kinase [Holosporaceae bacterium]|jgi:phosphoglycerate kinase|nr:phosphoglycerate kinase [Holosporaceae bacterium]
MLCSKIVTRSDFKDKKVLVRVDFNVPLEDGIVQDSLRIKNVVPTIEFLKSAGAKVILISHLGKTACFNKTQSLRNIVDKVAKECKSNVVFIDDCLDANASFTIDNTSSQNVILMENLRFYPEEEKCDMDFAKRLANLADFYINEAFSVSHRKHASIFAIPQFLPHAFGLSFTKEIRAINGFFSSALSPKMGIIGGAKLSTKINLLKNLVQKVDKLALGGEIANAFQSFGKNTPSGGGDSTAYAEEVSKIIENSRKYNCELIMPVDFYIAADSSIADIGHRSVELFQWHIRESKTILWNGPMGMFEKAQFDHGTKSLALEIAKLSRDGKLVSIIGGGDTAFAMNKFNVSQDLSYVSTAGGAFLAYLEGSELPGIAAMHNFYVLQQ